jgi:hypothetical protein
MINTNISSEPMSNSLRDFVVLLRIAFSVVGNEYKAGVARCETQHLEKMLGFHPPYREVGNADLVWNIDRPTYREVGNADLVWNIDRPTYREVGNADLVWNIDRPTYLG